MAKVVKGELKAEQTFKDAAEKFVAEYGVITAGERNEKYTQDNESRLRNHLIPYFGEMGLSEIAAGVVRDCRVHRLKANKDAAERTFQEAAKAFERAWEPSMESSGRPGVSRSTKWRCGPTCRRSSAPCPCHPSLTVRSDDVIVFLLHSASGPIRTG